MIWTIGHSTQSSESLIAALTSARIERLVDVRRYPGSRRHPQFNRDTLAAALAVSGIVYVHEPALGGRRTPAHDSVNTALRDPGFRGFADYMATPEFEGALEALIASASQRTAIMCAEAVPWRCHRSLIADALVARGLDVEHLVGAKSRPHQLTAAARVDATRVTYPGLI